MRLNRPWRLWLPLFCACALNAGAQTPQSSPTPQQQQNPFEAVPQVPSRPAPATSAPGQTAPPLEAPKAAPAVPPAAGPQDVIEAIEFRGARRVPQDTLRAMIFSKVGDRYTPETLRRDFMALWNTGRFDDITLETEQGKSGIIIRFIVVERQVIRSIKYEGIHAVSTSEILDRFKDKKVGLAVESQYDQNKVQRATVVLKEFLAERGHQYAEVTPELHQIPPASLEIIFHINEGPKVKVGKIQITGNQVFSNAAIVRAMHNSRPYGIPHSILFESLFPKSYDASKLEEDKEGIRNFYQEHGYWDARALQQTVTMRKVGGTGFRIPLIYPSKPGIRADITIPVEEGQQYTIRNFNYVGVKLLRVPESMTPKLFGMGPGDVFSTAKFRKGLDAMRELYGTFGYMDFVPDPEINPVPGSKNQVDITMNVDEGKQFYVRRIDFEGNTTTRDKVIRRELLLDEGDLFNSKMWELSIRRLNQLGYFEQLKKEDATQITRNPDSDTVDLTLKVKERGKNTIGLTGGVSAIAGSFIGLNYSTNNFLGLGETLSLSSQLGTRLRAVTFGFTEPYLFDKPIQTGFTVFIQRYSYDEAREASILSGQNLISYFSSLGSQNLINYISNSKGFTTFASYPLKRSFSRFGLTYSLSDTNYDPLTTAATTYFNYTNFEGINGPNTLTGIRTSMLTPSYSYNSVDNPINPSHGHSISVSSGVAGTYLGGNVNMVTPSMEFKYFHPGFKKGHVIGFRILGSFISGYGGRAAPPFNRFYIGGEQDVRGFDIMSLSPIAFIPSSTTLSITQNNGITVTKTLPVYQLISPGGDTEGIGNFEYRIPLVGPVTLATFFDIGIDRISRPAQLAVRPDYLSQLNTPNPSTNYDGAAFNQNAIIAAGTQDPRASTGLEIQVLLPVVNAPFRVYWAYNPMVVRETIQAPAPQFDPASFASYAQYQAFLAQVPQAYPYSEPHSTFRFTVGRTF